MTSKVKGRSRDGMWCVWQVLAHKSRTKSPRNNKIGRKVTHLTGNNAHQFQGQWLRSSGQLMVSSIVRHIFQMGRPTKFKFGIQMEHEDPYPRQAPWPPRSKVKVTRSITAETESISTEREGLRSSKLVRWWSMRYQVDWKRRTWKKLTVKIQGSENGRHENEGPPDQIAGQENAGHEIVLFLWLAEVAVNARNIGH